MLLWLSLGVWVFKETKPTANKFHRRRLRSRGSNTQNPNQKSRPTKKKKRYQKKKRIDLSNFRDWQFYWWKAAAKGEMKNKTACPFTLHAKLHPPPLPLFPRSLYLSLSRQTLYCNSRSLNLFLFLVMFLLGPTTGWIGTQTLASSWNLSTSQITR